MEYSFLIFMNDLFWTEVYFFTPNNYRSLTDELPAGCNDACKRVQEQVEASVGRKEKSVLQAKLTKLAIQIGYGGTLYATVTFSFVFLLFSCTSLIFGSRFFRAAAPAIWNSFPDSVRSSDSFNSFRRLLKTHISEQLPAPLAAYSSASD